MSTIRFKFTRGEELRFISHLDQQRLFQRAFRRAGLNIAHSNGFNPHPKLSFALAMSVGLMSDSEYGDVVLTRDIDLTEFTKRLNASLPEGLKVVEARRIPQGKASLSASLTDSRYRIEVALEPRIDAASLNEALSVYQSLDEVILEKEIRRESWCLKISVPLFRISGFFPYRMGLPYWRSGSNTLSNRVSSPSWFCRQSTRP